jgi:hypothetical protein
MSLKQICWLLFLLPLQAFAGELNFSTNPVTRWIEVRYQVPDGAPDLVRVECEWAPAGEDQWQAAVVMPLVSETALSLLPAEAWTQWRQGVVEERRAAGLIRTVRLNPYPDAQVEGRVDLRLRVRVLSPEGAEIASHEGAYAADNSDVLYVEDWSKLISTHAFSTEVQPRKWQVRTAQEAATGGTDLFGTGESDVALPPVAYPLDLKGMYAVFACTQPGYGVMGRFTGDERSDILSSRRLGEEVLWRWTKMDRQHLVLDQSHGYTGYTPSQIDYLKFVPLDEATVEALNLPYVQPVDKTVAGYFEPYSWAFYDDVRETLHHRKWLLPYRNARLQIVDIQIGRFGMKSVYETRLTDQLIYGTIGDPIGDVVQPVTTNVGKMQQYTNTLETELRYAQEMALRPFANFGAANAYNGTPLEGDFAKDHPEWLRGAHLRYEVPEVRAYALGLYREALEIGAPGVSIDFCRYPEAIDTAETCNGFLRELRALTQEFSARRGEPVTILVRFPGTGVRLHELFDYRTWIAEGLVDYLAPSNIQGRHMHIDMSPYLGAVQGTQVKLLPALDGLNWGLAWPGMILQRVARLYEQGAEGLYVYQADARLLGIPEDRRAMALLSSSAAVGVWQAGESALQPRYSKGIYITPPHEFGIYHGWERIRIWTDGIAQGPLEVSLDGNVVGHMEAPPYLLGTEDSASDNVVPPGEHTLTVRAKDGEGSLEQRFQIKGAG